MDKFLLFVYTLMRNARILCIIHTSIFGVFSAEKKFTSYMGKYVSVNIMEVSKLTFQLFTFVSKLCGIGNAN